MKKLNPKGFRYYHIISMIFVASLLIANTIAVKTITIGGLSIAAGILCFPISYIINDVLTEVYGFEKARSTIWWGFACLFLMTFIYYIAIQIEPAYFWKKQEHFEIVFSTTFQIAIGSFLAFLIGSMLNSIVLSKMKVIFKGKMLWARTIGSTIIGEGMDSIIFNLIAFYGIFTFSEIGAMIWAGFLLKTLYEIIATPITYYIVGKLKSLESVDQYDEGISYRLY